MVESLQTSSKHLILFSERLSLQEGLRQPLCFHSFGAANCKKCSISTPDSICPFLALLVVFHSSIPRTLQWTSSSRYLSSRWPVMYAISIGCIAPHTRRSRPPACDRYGPLVGVVVAYCVMRLRGDTDFLASFFSATSISSIRCCMSSIYPRACSSYPEQNARAS